MTDPKQCSNTKWIATAYDSDRGYALGDTPEQAMQRYREEIGEPAFELDFSIIRNRDDYREELARVGKALGFFVEQSIPLFLAMDWIIVARITPEGVAALEGCDRATHLLHDWSRDDGEYFITARPAAQHKPSLSRAEKRAEAANITAIEGIEPSKRQQDWAQESPYNWISEMAWAHNKGEIELTRAEITYVQARYGDAAHCVHVSPVYRLPRDARKDHRPDAGPELVKKVLAAGYKKSEVAQLCGVSREHVRLLAEGARAVSFPLQVLLENMATSRPVR